MLRVKFHLTWPECSKAPENLDNGFQETFMAEALTEHLKWVDSVGQLPIIPALFVFSTCVHMEM